MLNSFKIRKELGYQEDLSLSDGLKKTIAWERENPLCKYDLKEFDYETEDAILAKIIKGRGQS